MDGKAKKPGRLNVLKATHLADGTDLELSVQAVWKWGMSGNAYIIVHPHLPKAATSNWTEMVSKVGSSCALEICMSWNHNNISACQGSPGKALLSAMTVPFSALLTPHS